MKSLDPLPSTLHRAPRCARITSGTPQGDAMTPPVEIRDRSEYKRRMNELFRLDPRRTVVMTVDMQNDYLDMKHATAPTSPEEAKRVIGHTRDRKSTRLNSSHGYISYAVFCLKKK